MQSKLIISCQCEKFSASVFTDPVKKHTRLVCYCTDCQSYAWHLGKESQQLDEQGGSDVLQLSPAQFEIVRGKELLANLKLTPGGVYRWYTRCCNTAIANTPTNMDMPYVGLLTRTIKKVSNTSMTGSKSKTHKKGSASGRSIAISDDKREEQLDNSIGKVQFGVGAGSRHPLQAKWPVSKGFGFRGMFYSLRNIGRWRLRGDHKKSELFNADSGEPIVEGVLISKEQRTAALKNVIRS